jgi:proton-coupled amino acid transporter
MFLQVWCKTKLGSHIESYSDLGLAIFGKWGKFFIDLCITISQIGFCIAYLLFIGN